MGETFKYAAPVAGALGFSAEDTAEAIGLMANAGIKSSQAGTSLRTIMNSMTGPIELAGENLGSVTIQTQNADGSMRSLSDILSDCRGAFSQMNEAEQANAAQSLVGTEAMSGFLSLMNAAPTDIDKLSGAIEGCDGASEQMAATMQDNLAGQLTILKSQLEELAISFGEIMMPAIRDIVTAIQGFVDKLNALPEPVKEIILKIGLFVAALGPVLVVIGKILGAVGTVMTVAPKIVGALSGVKNAFGALHAVMLANPIAILIAAIAALVAAFIYLWNTNEDFRNFWIQLWEDIQQAVVTAWEAITSFLSSAWENIKQIASTVWEGIKTVITTAVTAIQTFLTTAWNAIKAAITAVLEAIKTVVTTVWNGIKTVITTIVNAIRTVITTVWNGIKSAITTVVNAIRSVISSGFNAAKNAVSTAVNAIRTGAVNAFNTMLSGIKQVCGNIYSAVKGGFDTAIEFITGLAEKAFDWGKDFVMGIVNGIKSAVDKVGEAVGEVADKIKSVLHFSRPDEGPLKDYETWMPDFMAGLSRGIEKSRGLIQSAMRDVTSDMTLTPSVSVAGAGAASPMSGGDIAGSIASAVGSVLSGTNQQQGDIVIPVYIGSQMLDEIVVSAQQRMNLRSGGR